MGFQPYRSPPTPDLQDRHGVALSTNSTIISIITIITITTIVTIITITTNTTNTTIITIITIIPPSDLQDRHGVALRVQSQQHLAPVQEPAFNRDLDKYS